MSYSVSGQRGWDNAIGKLLDVEKIATQNTTASLTGVGQWIWPVTLGIVALVLGFVWLRKKGK